MEGLSDWETLPFYIGESGYSLRVAENELHKLKGFCLIVMPSAYSRPRGRKSIEIKRERKISLYKKNKFFNKEFQKSKQL